MKHFLPLKRQLALFWLVGLLALSACSSGKVKARTGETASIPAPHNNQADLGVCEQIVRADLADETASFRNYSAELKQTIQRAYSEVDEFGISILNADHRYKTQDGKPDVKSVSPAFRKDARVMVPVAMQWPGNAPYTVTWILDRQGGNWLITDLVTSGHEHDNGSLLASLRSR